MQTKLVGAVTGFLLCGVISGCATSRSEVQLSSPVATSSPAPTTGKTVVIRTIKDLRAFEQSPSEPSTPSLGFEGAAQASAEIKARAIGRKRNTFGQALGDVLLPAGQTVESVVRENLTAALQQAGYQVKSAEAGGSAPSFIDVEIRKFWAWVQPGFWAITLRTHIATDLKMSGDALPTIVSVQAEEGYQIVTDGAWIEVVEKALVAYRSQAAAKTVAAP